MVLSPSWIVPGGEVGFSSCGFRNWDVDHRRSFVYGTSLISYGMSCFGHDRRFRVDVYGKLSLAVVVIRGVLSSSHR